MAKRDAVKKRSSWESWAKVVSTYNFTNCEFEAISKTLIDSASRALSSEKTNNDEKQELAAALERFSSSRDVLMGDLEDIHPTEKKKRFIDNLTALLISTMAIAQFKLPSHRTRHKVDELRARELRDAKASKNKPREERLMAFLKERHERQPLIDSDKHADSLRAEADFAPVRDGKWPSTQTVRRAIKVILTECGNCL